MDIVSTHDFDQLRGIAKLSWRRLLNDYDVVHGHMLRPQLATLSFKLRARLVSTIHSDIRVDLSDSHGLLGRVVSPLWLGVLRHFDANVVLSQFQKHLYESYIPNVHCIGNGLEEFQRFEERAETSQTIQEFAIRGKTLVSVGSFRKLKGLRQIIALLDASDYRCVFFGDGPEYDETQSYAKSCGVSDRCLFLGYVSSASVYFKYFDCFLITSFSEGFPISLLEAARAKIPIVTSNIPNLTCLMNGGLATYSVGEVASLKKCIDSSILDTDRVERLFRCFVAEHTISAVSKMYEGLYQEVLGQ